MSPRLKKFLGIFILLGGFFAYVIVAITIADYLPNQKFVQIAYFAVAGISWIFPVKYLLRWMNSEHRSK